MCWLTKACPSTTSVIVFLRSAPRARIGRSTERGNRARRVSARAAQNCRAESAHARDGIVYAAGNLPLADQKGVGDAGKTFECFFIVVSDRLARTIGAGHHQNFWRARVEE